MKKIILLIILTAFIALIVAQDVQAANLPTVLSPEERLASEVQKMIDAGHLRPSYTIATEGYGAALLKLDYPNAYDDVWHNPADTLYTLAIALPYVPDALYPTDSSKTWKDKVKEYMQNEYTTYQPWKFTHTGSTGARRERNDIPSIVTSYSQYYSIAANPVAISWNGWSFNPFNFYGLYKYAEVFNNAGEILANLRAAHHVPVDFHSTVRTDAWLSSHPHVLNSYIAGYIGYLNLQDSAGETRDSQVETWLADAEALRVQQLPAAGSDNSSAVNLPAFEAGGFLWLVPELGDYLYTHAYDQVAKQVADHQDIAPYWMVAKADEATRASFVGNNEGSISHYYEYSSLFNAKAYALKENKSELEKYLDVPGVWRGDLFYIQNLVSVLEAPSTGITVSPTPNGSGSPTPTSTPSTPGDTDDDGDVDIFDYNAVITDFGKTGGQGFSVADFDGDNDVDIFDYNVVISNFGQ